MYSQYHCNVTRYLKTKSNCNLAKQDEKQLIEILYKNQFEIAVKVTPPFPLRLKLGVFYVLILRKINLQDLNIYTSYLGTYSISLLV